MNGSVALKTNNTITYNCALYLVYLLQSASNKPLSIFYKFYVTNRANFDKSSDYFILNSILCISTAPLFPEGLTKKILCAPTPEVA